ncbi:MAG: site-specific DNA-methyltransferase [Oscillospiraceae bacterium]
MLDKHNNKCSSNLEKILSAQTFKTPEHVGGYNWTMLHGDTLAIAKEFKPGTFDAVITDPPYASGGAKPSEKSRTTNQKYSSMAGEKALPDFDGDQKDQRSWTRWAAEWLAEVRRACKPGAVLCVFIDWRMAPALSDAIQWAGWIWRGQIVWDKQNSRPQKGRFRQQSEYVLWASNGPLPINRPVGCLPGVFRYTNPQNRVHVTEKPLTLMREIVKICVPGGRILDPFAGSGTTVLAAVQEGYEAVGIEVTDAYFKIGGDRVKLALENCVPSPEAEEKLAEATDIQSKK